ncbi:hypothetical protein L208DRAFT_1402852 [Tricholoma matsutake]|nr:hypothetical protein L208DRAFT_1406759 [Tricholoma matsutake 945]KAF8229006.1 hypothetical protein L208DRAFT_1402852 [Tricholoma matsutake 945]
MSVTQHRYHCAGTFPAFSREEGDDYIFYYSRDCPGIDDPTSRNHFPIINTLSIPFSLIHNFPRMVAITPHHTHQQELITMSSEILRLCWWDPSPEMIKRSGELRIQNLAENQHNNTPSAKPYPIHHVDPAMEVGNGGIPACDEKSRIYSEWSHYFVLIIVERDQLEVIVADHNHQRRLDSDIDNLDVVSKLLSSLQVELSVGILRFLIISPLPRNSDTVRSSHRHQLRLASNDIHTRQPDKRCLKRTSSGF